MNESHPRFAICLLATLLTGTPLPAQTGAWWDEAWTVRNTITIDTAAEGLGLGGPVGTAPVLIRLFDGNFPFDSAQDNGADLRFVAADQKTVLPHHIERYDRALNEAYVWVQVPDLDVQRATTLHLYSGHAGQAPPPAEAKATYDVATGLVYHFSETSGPPVDISGGGASATATGLPVAGSLIAGGVRLTGQNAVAIPASASLAWTENGALTWSAWIRPASLRPNAILFSRREGARAFLIGEDNGVPFVQVDDGADSRRTPAGPPLDVDTWRHLAVTAENGTLTLWLDGERYAALAAPLPALAGPATLGLDEVAAASPAAAGFNGEIDELQIAGVARPPAWLRFAALNQGTSTEASRLVVVGTDEAAQTVQKKTNFLIEHFGIFAYISRSLTFDGWIVIGLCALLALVGAVVAVVKLLYLNRIDKATRLFIKRWDDLSSDITALDKADEAELGTLGGSVAGSELRVVRQSPLFHIYHLGAHEIRKRIEADGDAFAGLSGRSIEAIKARLDGGLVDEEEKLNSNLVFLTLGIAGGPYLGLLGTVVGVMITFAIISQTGEVEVNSIAPGIAGALLATVAGLAVAIPALFSYSYLNSRITSAINGIRKFIDEFITRIAEAYPTKEQP